MEKKILTQEEKEMREINKRIKACAKACKSQTMAMHYKFKLDKDLGLYICHKDEESFYHPEEFIMCARTFRLSYYFEIMNNKVMMRIF